MLKGIITIFLMIPLIYVVVHFTTKFKESNLAGVREPYLQMLTPESVYIRWLTDDTQLGVVRFGEQSGHMETRKLETSATKNHSVKLSNLKPGTRYYYQTGNRDSFNAFDPEKHWFYTHPENDIPTRVWVIGDPGVPGELLYQVRDTALKWMQENPLLTDGSDDNVNFNTNKPQINVWIALGDLAYESGTNEQFQSALFEPFENITANTALWPVYGNHDHRRWTYFKIFTLPENAEAGGVASHTENYYSFDYANAHFVVLDSQGSNRSATGKMASWLKNDLAQNTKPWLIAAFHHPPYTKGTHDSDDPLDSSGKMQDMRKNIVPILEQGGVDLVLSGHSHTYERSYLMGCAYDKSSAFSPKNIVSSGVNNKHQEYIKPKAKQPHQGAIYVVTGSAAKVGSGLLDHPAHYIGLIGAGSMVIDINENKLIARFINHRGQVRDTFSIRKDDQYVSHYQGCD
ncbi:metallophosphoesterase [methanotrophic bacterial endosymbiont of Bathymodiolus sp.]|nr:metallophosphoesterase [methanotrophic bacterial endosymbiont of Bathymodiolus sp.]